MQPELDKDVPPKGVPGLLPAWFASPTPRRFSNPLSKPVPFFFVFFAIYPPSPEQRRDYSVLCRENTLVGAEFISALRAHVKCAPTFLYAFGVFIHGGGRHPGHEGLRTLFIARNVPREPSGPIWLDSQRICVEESKGGTGFYHFDRQVSPIRSIILIVGLDRVKHPRFSTLRSSTATEDGRAGHRK